MQFKQGVKLNPVELNYSHLIQDLDEDLHAADEDGGESFDLLQVLAKALPLAGVQKVFLTTLNIMGHLNFSQ